MDIVPFERMSSNLFEDDFDVYVYNIYIYIETGFLRNTFLFKIDFNNRIVRLYGYDAVCHSIQRGSALRRRYLGKRASRQANEAKQASLPREIGMSPVRSNPVPLLTLPPLLPSVAPIVAAASDFLSPPPLCSLSVHLMLYSYFAESQCARQRRIVRKRKTVKDERNCQ